MSPTSHRVSRRVAASDARSGVGRAAPERTPRSLIAARVGGAVYPAAVGGLALLVFALTLAPSVTAEDSGELIAAAWHFGVPHPPGYPLWTLLCGLFLRLAPLPSIAERANLFSALCSTAAALCAYAALRETGISRLAAASAALCWVWTRWSWSQSVITEVYALNSLVVAAGLWCALRWYRTRRDRPLMVGSLLFGLGLCNHHTSALAGLGLVIWIVLTAPQLLRRISFVARCLGLLALALLPYAYLPLRAAAQPPMNWGDPSTVQRFVEHVSRSQYGAVGPMKTAEPRSLKRFGAQAIYLVDSVRDDMTTWLLGGALVGMLVLARHARGLLLLTLLWVGCTGVLFVILANYDLDRTSRWAMRVFFIPVSLGLALPLAFLFDRFLIGARRLSGHPALVRALAAALVLGAPALQATAQWSHCDYSHYWYALDHGRNLLACMLPKAMVFPMGDHNAFPLVYLVQVEGDRPDVLIADAYGYLLPELYRDRPADSPEPPDTWLINRARRPVYCATKKAPPVPGAAFVTAGLLYHLLPSGMEFAGRGLLEQCRYRNLDGEASTVLDLGACHILADYEFFSGLRELEDGNRDAALRHFRAAAGYGAGIKEVYNNLGSALGEYGLHAEALTYFQEAARLDRRYALPRWNLFRLCKAQAQWEEARRHLQEIISVHPDEGRAYGELGFLLRDEFHDPRGAARAWIESLRCNPDQPELTQALESVSAHAP